MGALTLDEFLRRHARDVRCGEAASRRVCVGAWTRRASAYGASSTTTRAEDLEEARTAMRRGNEDDEDDGSWIVRAVEGMIGTRGTTSSSTTMARSSGGVAANGRAKRSGAFGYRPGVGEDVTVVLDCAGKIARHYGAKRLDLTVRALRRHPAVALVVTLERGEAPASASATGEASCSVVVTAVENDARATRGVYEVELRRPCGRRRRERESVTVREDLGLTFAPIEIESVASAVARALKLGETDPATEEARAAARLQSAVPFNLGVSLSAEELEAKRNVKLSYEHQGVRGVDAYDKGDFLAFLPPDAGGRGDALGVTKPGRGHIYYERDAADDALDDDDLFPDTDDEEEDF